MKKILSLTMALAMLGTALTGCGSKDAAAQTPAENTQQTAPVQQEQSQTEKALALINTFATGDTDTARSLLADGYIQHNLAYGTGADAFIGSVEYLASADVKTTVNNIRAFEDGDKVFLQTIYNFAGAGEQVAFDIFRFDEDGKIAEHWDNLAALAEPNPSGHNEAVIREMVTRQENMKIPTELLPTCPHCGKPLTMNLRSDNKFVEDEGWHRAAERYENFLRTHAGQKILFLELGVGYNTPVIIKYPFWQMTAKNPNAIYACINQGQAVCPREIQRQAICINIDLGNALQELS